MSTVTINLGADAGNRNTKAVSSRGGQLHQVVYPSTVGTGREISLKLQQDHTKSPDHIQIKISGQDYFVGQLAERESYDASLALDETRVGHEYTRVLIVTAAVMLAPERERWVKVNLVAGMPTVHYRDQGLRKQFASRMQERVFEVEFRGRRQYIQFVSALPFPEGAAPAFALMRPEFETARIGIINCGSWRSDYLVLNEMEYEDRSSGTLPLGMHQALLQVQANTGTAQLLHEVEAAAERDPGGLMMEQLTAARRAKARQIADSIRGKWLNMDFYALILVGGGASALKEFFPQAVIAPDPVMATARGLYEVGVLANANNSVSRASSR